MCSIKIVPLWVWFVIDLADSRDEFTVRFWITLMAGIQNFAHSKWFDTLGFPFVSIDF